MALELVIFVGLPGSGKTTFYRTYFAATHRHVSKDLQPHAQRREARQQRTLDELLGRGESVVVDNTNPSETERRRLIAAARAHAAHIVGYFFDVTTRQAVGRNARRTGRDRVPNVAIFTAAKRLDRPSLAEGFDQLFVVNAAPERTFTVREVPRSEEG